MVISNSILDEHRRYKDKMESTDDEAEKMLYKAAMWYSAGVRKKKTDMLHNLLEDTKVMIDERKKEKKQNKVLLSVAVIVVGTVSLWLIFREAI